MKKEKENLVTKNNLKNEKIRKEQDKIFKVDLKREKEKHFQKNRLEDKNNKVIFEIEDRKRKAKIFLLVNVVIFLIAIIFLGFILYFISKTKNISNKSLVSYQSTETKQGNDGFKSNYLPRKIDGVKVSPNETNSFLMAVMIDNHSDARPPSGISQAHLVFEAEVEGGITRIMAIFSAGQEIREIGPVRSARPYFIDWARELSALYVHVGGSPDALVKIQQDKILDINEFFNGQYFWRNKKKPRPHNVYTSTENLEKYLDHKNADHNRFVPWLFKEEAKENDRATSSLIYVDYKLGMYKIKWEYNKKDNNYLRYVAGDLYKDTDNKTITAKNILIQVADAHELDDKLRLEMENIGKGKSLICLDGKCQPGIWQKKHPSDRTRFYLEDGREARFNPGTTWIEVVRPEVKYRHD